MNALNLGGGGESAYVADGDDNARRDCRPHAFNRLEKLCVDVEFLEYVREIAQALSFLGGKALQDCVTGLAVIVRLFN